MKQYEKLVHRKLLSLVSPMISSQQHGFLPNRSCQTQMVAFVDSLHLSLNSGHHVDIVYFDFAKAFDSVNHDTLLLKIKNTFKINGKLLQFLKCYLSGRKQRVVIGNSFSNLCDVLSGVPQGSIVGPLLFVLFINDIGEGISENTNLLMYADDTKMWRTIHSDSDNTILQNDIDHLLNWANRNKMKFNTDKCKILPVTRKYNIGNSQFVYKLGPDLIKYTDEEKDLGVYITSKANFTSHCDKIYKKANSRLALTKRSCHFVKNIPQKRTLYLAMTRSLFEHCSVVWNPCNVSTVTKLESLQKRSIKWILGEEYCSYSSLDYFIRCRKLQVLPLKQKLILNDLVFLHSIINGLIKAPLLPNYLSFFQPSARRVLRSCHLDSLSLVSSVCPQISPSYSKNSVGGSEYKVFGNSFFYRSHLLWNRLPLGIREIIKPTLFKSNVVKYLWEVGFSEVIEGYEDQELPLMSRITTPPPPSLLLDKFQLPSGTE